MTDLDIRTKNDGSISVSFCGTAAISVLDAAGNCLDSGRFCDIAALHIDHPILWNAEKPYLYELVISCAGETIRQQIGFVEYGVNAQHAFTVNGVEVKLKGVNHHDTHPTNGYSMTEEELLQDLRLMKKLNINCIRTSHYPPHPKFLLFCNQMGFYVMLETDLETHGFPAAQQVGMALTAWTEIRHGPETAESGCLRSSTGCSGRIIGIRTKPAFLHGRPEMKAATVRTIGK